MASSVVSPQEFLGSEVPRSTSLARSVARQTFPTWQLILLALPYAIYFGAASVLLFGIGGVLLLGKVVGRLPETAMFVIVAIGLLPGLYLAGRIALRRRRAIEWVAQFGTVGAVFAPERGSLQKFGGALSEAVGQVVGTVAGAAVDAITAPTVAASFGSSTVVARTPQDWRGRTPTAHHMVYSEGRKYVILISEREFHAYPVYRVDR